MCNRVCKLFENECITGGVPTVWKRGCNRVCPGHLKTTVKPREFPAIWKWVCKRVIPDHLKTSVKLRVARQFENEHAPECLQTVWKRSCNLMLELFEDESITGYVPTIWKGGGNRVCPDRLKTNVQPDVFRSFENEFETRCGTTIC